MAGETYVLIYPFKRVDNLQVRKQVQLLGISVRPAPSLGQIFPRGKD